MRNTSSPVSRLLLLCGWLCGIAWESVCFWHDILEMRTFSLDLIAGNGQGMLRDQMFSRVSRS